MITQAIGGLVLTGNTQYSYSRLFCHQPTVSVCLQEENKKLKSKQKDKMQPKMGKLDIDYQVLHDAFFKYQNKPNFSIMGDLYYEGKEFEAKVSCGSAHVLCSTGLIRPHLHL